jgi:hypothetical protein
VVVLLLVFMIGVYASPYLAVHNLKKALSDGDADELRDTIDFPALRASLKEEVGGQIANYMKQESKEDGNEFAALGSALASGFTGVFIDQYVTPQGLAGLADSKKTAGEPNAISRLINRLSRQPSGADDPVLSAGYESYGRFQIRIAPAHSTEAIRFIMLRSALISWRLSEIRIPDLSKLGSLGEDVQEHPVGGAAQSARPQHPESEVGNVGCRSYFSDNVTLRGTIEPKTFPGPPNFESVEKGDAAEDVWLFNLETPICTKAGEANPDGSQYTPAEADVRSMQMLFDNSEMYDRYRNLLGREVTVTGSLGHAFTGHHHTSVMINIVDIQP